MNNLYRFFRILTKKEKVMTNEKPTYNSEMLRALRAVQKSLASVEGWIRFMGVLFIVIILIIMCEAVLEHF